MLESIHKELHRTEVKTQKLAVEKEATLHLAEPIFKKLQIKVE